MALIQPQIIIKYLSLKFVWRHTLSRITGSWEHSSFSDSRRIKYKLSLVTPWTAGELRAKFPLIFKWSQGVAYLQALGQILIHWSIADLLDSHSKLSSASAGTIDKVIVVREMYDLTWSEQGYAMVNMSLKVSFMNWVYQRRLTVISSCHQWYLLPVSPCWEWLFQKGCFRHPQAEHSLLGALAYFRQKHSTGSTPQP